MKYLHGVTFEDLILDRMRVDASERCFERLIEAVVRIERYRPELVGHLAVRKMHDYGNLLRHRYEEVAEEFMWMAYHHHLPTVVATANAIREEAEARIRASPEKPIRPPCPKD